MTMPIKPVVVMRLVDDAVEPAFIGFRRDFGLWWPVEYTFNGSADRLNEIVLGDQVGGLCSEIGPHGFRIDWGRVIRFEPPTDLHFLWQINPDSTPNPDPKQASMVEVRFAPFGHQTRVTLTHHSFERHGEAAASYRQEMASQAGWPLLLDRYAAFVAKPGAR